MSVRIKMVKNENGNGDSKIRNWFFSEIGFLLSFGATIVSIVLFVIVPIKNIESRIAVIESNHLYHMQVAEENIEKIFEQIQKIEEEQKTQNELLIQLKTMHTTK